MKHKAGERVKALRELIGFTREDFADLLGIDFVRLRNIEQRKVRMAEEEFAVIGKSFPEMIHWIAYEGDISLDGLRNSEENLCRLIAAKYVAGQLPDGFELESKIKE